MDSVRVFLEAIAKANTDLQNCDANTALICACQRGYVEIALAISEAGANKDLQNNHANTALICAIDNVHVQIAMALYCLP